MSAAGWLRQVSTSLVFMFAVLLPSVALAGSSDPAAPQPPASNAAAPEPAPAAAPEGFFKPGDLAVTGFSGTMLAGEGLPPGVDPIDRTLIDPTGPALRVLDVSNLGGSPAGKSVQSPIRLDIPASQIGQVFGLTFGAGPAGAPPDLYVGATSAFGLNIVGAGQAADGKPVRLKAGAPDAAFMEGQFGSLSTGSPGAIYKIDGTTGAVSYLSDTAFSGKANSGPGIGGLAFDAASRSLYASDLDTGVIHRFGLDYNAADLSQFDHGIAGRRAKGLDTIADDGKRLLLTDPAFSPSDPATWGFTQPSRRIDALAVHDGRLYYAVAEGPEIWSVGLSAGEFLTDARLEVKVKAEKPYPITGIAFDAQGRMYLAQRGPQKSPFDYGVLAEGGADVLRYAPAQPVDPAAEQRWVPEPESYAVGTADDSRAADGGVSLQYGYKPDGSIDLGACDASVAMTGDALTPTVSGTQLNGLDLVRPANVPPNQSSFIDYDQRDDDPGLRGHVGNALALRKCGDGAGAFPPVEDGGAFPPVEDAPGGDFPPVEDGGAGGGGGEAFPAVEDGGAGGGGETFPEVEEGTDEAGGGGETAEAGGISITKSPGEGKCTQQGGCAFNIDITNNSGAELPEITVGDELTGGAANLAGATIEGAPPAPWTCTAPPKFSCTHKQAIKDGETISLPLSFAPKGIGEEPELKNCATVQAGGPADAAGVPEPIGPVCASLPVEESEGATGGKTQSGPITIEKTPTTPTCDEKTPCGFDIVVSNTSNAEIPGPITIADTFPPDVKLTTPVLPWSCEPEKAVGTTIPCSHPGPVPANGSLPPLKFTFPPPVGATTVENCATLGAPLPAGIDAPATSACATVQVPTPVQPPVQPPLRITKGGVAQCSDLGGGCNFTIDVTNDGDVPFIGEVDISEEPTADGIFIEGTKLVKPTGGWTCDPAGSAFSCKSGKVEIAPKQKITLDLGVLLGKLTGANQLQNCASIVGQANKACVTAQLVNGPKLVLKKEMLGDGTCAPSCTARITLTNTGNQPVAPPVKILDVLPGPTDALLDTVANHSGGNFDCSKLNKKAITCNLTTPLDPGKEVFVDLALRMNAIDFAGENCVQLQEFTAADPASLRTCVPMSIKRPAGPNLEIEKQAPGAKTAADEGHCDLKGVCTFTITVKNTGSAPFTDPIKIEDTISGGTPELIEKFPVGTARWECGTVKNNPAAPLATNFTECEVTPKPGGLQPGESEVLLINVKPGNTWKGGNKLKNCAEIKNPAEDIGPTGLVKDCAKAKLDPFDVDVTKTGDQSCQPGGLCTFDINIFNSNETVTHDDPVTVTDKLTGLSSAEIVSITKVGQGQDFPCKPAPTKVPFSCTGHMTLPPKTENHYTVVIRLPADATAASFSNCASLGSEGSDAAEPRSRSGAVPVGQGESQEGCHQVQLSPPAPTLKINKTGPATCAQGKECSFDVTLSNTGREAHVGTISMTDGLSGVSSMPIVSIDPPLPCTSQPKEIPFNCGTGSDFTLAPDASRKFRITARVPRSAEDFTNCMIVSAGGPEAVPQARNEDAISSCHSVKIADATPPPEKPECKGGMILTAEGMCACPPGTRWNGRSCTEPVSPVDNGPGGGGTIVPPPPPPKVCPRSLPVGKYPNCCERGTHFDPRVNPPRGACVSDGRSGTDGTIINPPPPPPPPVCKGARPIGTFPNCCPRGTNFSRGACRSNVVEPGECRNGTRRINGVCKKPECPSGMFGDWPRCCPTGTRFEDGKCVKPGPGTGGTQGSTDPCPNGERRINGVCPKPKCPSGMFGEWPRCCPNGTRLEKGKCVKPGPGTGGTDGNNDKCAAGTIGKPPNCKCPIGMTGRPPNCCPPGTRFENGKCVRPKVTVPCTGGRIGTPPNCSCPPGTHWARSERCLPDAPSKTTPSKTEEPKGKCTRGMVGTPPNCFCPAPKRMFRGRCTIPPKPTPTPTTPKCSGSTPRGTYPNCCSADNWNPTKNRCEKFTGPK